jgi:putative addiction module component (TIGR02574 family)
MCAGVGAGSGQVVLSLKPDLSVCQQERYYTRMSVTAKKVAEVLALPEQDRAYLARQLIASLDETVDADAETQWQEVIDRRSHEIEEGKVGCRPVEHVVQDIRTKLSARRQPSRS